MASPYRARVNEREFLNLPGFHGWAEVSAYVEDTSEHDLQLTEGRRAHNIQPRVILELSDCSGRVTYVLEVHSALALENSQHLLEVITARLQRVADTICERGVLVPGTAGADRPPQRRPLGRRRGPFLTV